MPVNSRWDLIRGLKGSYYEATAGHVKRTYEEEFIICCEVLAQVSFKANKLIYVQH